MPSIYPIYTNFTKGEMSPFLNGRVDLAQYDNALKTCENFVVMPQGGVIRRGGVTYIRDCVDPDTTGNVRLIPFIFSQNPNQSNVIEIGYDDGNTRSYVKIHKANDYTVAATVTSVDGSGADLPWASSDIPNIDYYQINDTVYIADGNHALHKIVREGATTWKVKQVSIVGEVTITNEPITWNLYTWSPNGLHPDDNYSDAERFKTLWQDYPQTNANLHRPHILASGAHSPATYAMAWGNPANPYAVPPTYISDRYDADFLMKSFDTDRYWGVEYNGQIFIPNDGTDRWYFGLNSSGGQVEIGKVGQNAPHVVVNDRTNKNPRSEDNTEFQSNGYVEETDLNLDAQNFLRVRFYNSAQHLGAAGSGEFGVALAWRNDGHVIADSNNGGSHDAVIGTRTWNGNNIYEIKVEIYDSGTKFKIYEREQTGIDPDVNDDSDWSGAAVVDNLAVASYVGAGNTYSLSSANGFTANLGEIYFEGTTVSNGDFWTMKFGFLVVPVGQMTKKSAAGGTPRPKYLSYYENRLVIAGFSNEPQRILLSSLRSPEDFNVKDETTDDDAIDRIIGGSKADPIVGAVAAPQGLVILTSGGLYLAQGEDGKVTPDNFKVHLKAANEAKAVKPILIDYSVYFVEANGKVLNGMIYDFASDSFRVQDVSIFSEHLVENGIKELAFMRSGIVCNYAPPINILWVLDDDTNPKLRGLTLEREHEVFAWHKHTVLSDSDVKSIVTVPDANGGDELWMIVNHSSTLKLCYLKSSVNTDNGGTNVNFTSTLETMPIEISLPQGGTSQGAKKGWSDFNVKAMHSTDFTVARASDSSDTQSMDSFSSRLSGTPSDVNFKILSYDDESKMQIKQTTQNQAMILAIHGKMQVNLK